MIGSRDAHPFHAPLALKPRQQNGSQVEDRSIGGDDEAHGLANCFGQFRQPTFQTTGYERRQMATSTRRGGAESAQGGMYAL
jgi:hypothetical protein